LLSCRHKGSFGIPFRWCARHGAQRLDWRYSGSCGGFRKTWRCKSSTGPARGTVSRTARVSTARWNLKEAEGKALARRTGIAYEATAVGETANIFKARYLHGNCRRRCGGHKCEGRAHYPGRSARLPQASAAARWRDGCAEVSRGHSRWSNRPLKGRTREMDWAPDRSMGRGVADWEAERSSLARGGSGRNLRDNRDKATSPTARPGPTHEGPTWR